MTIHSINVGRKHQNPIPSAARIGSLVMSSVIIGNDPETNAVPPDLASQCANMFRNIRLLAEAAGGTVEDIIKLTVWLADLGDRAALNKEWLEMYPDPAHRPARHSRKHIGNPDHLILSEFTMVLGSDE